MTDAMTTMRTVYLVDDDAAICHALTLFLESSGYRVLSFRSAEAFLEMADSAGHGVVLLDQRMMGMTGLELQSELNSRGIHLPIIFITGHGDVQMSVRAIKAGAIDFLEKPFTNEELLTSLKEAFIHAANTTRRTEQLADLRNRFATLTPREREVIQHVVEGMSNRSLGAKLGVSDRTIEVHRSRVMKKMGADSLPDLVRKYAICQEAGQ